MVDGCSMRRRGAHSLRRIRACSLRRPVEDILFYRIGAEILRPARHRTRHPGRPGTGVLPIDTIPNRSVSRNSRLSHLSRRGISRKLSSRLCQTPVDFRWALDTSAPTTRRVNYLILVPQRLERGEKPRPWRHRRCRESPLRPWAYLRAPAGGGATEIKTRQCSPAAWPGGSCCLEKPRVE